MGDVRELLALAWLWRTAGTAVLRCGGRSVSLPIQSINNADLETATHVGDPATLALPVEAVEAVDVWDTCCALWRRVWARAEC